MPVLIGIDDCVILCGRLAWKALARVLWTVRGVAQAFSEQGVGVINSDWGDREHLQHQHGHGHLKHEEEHRGSRGNFEAPVTKDIGALLLRQPADRLAVGETLHNKKWSLKKIFKGNTVLFKNKTLHLSAGQFGGYARQDRWHLRFANIMAIGKNWQIFDAHSLLFRRPNWLVEGWLSCPWS